MPSVNTFSSNGVGSEYYCGRSHMNNVPPMTVLVLLTRLQTTSSVRVTVIRISSKESLSSLRSITSLSFSAFSHLTHFSAANLDMAHIGDRDRERNKLTEWPLLDLLGRQAKDRQYLNSHLDDDCSHCGSGRDRRINFQSRNKALNAIKDIYEDVIAFSF
jgi:hypothetical protein